MKRFQVVWPLAVGALGLTAILGRGQTSETLGFQEVYGLVRSHLTNLSEAELNRAAVAGLLNELKGQAILVTNATSAAASEPEGPLVSKTKVFDDAYGYIRILEVNAGLGRAFDAAYQEVLTTNQLKGLVIDLRFAGGHDYLAVADVASRFIETEQPLFKLGETTIRSKGRENPITLPVAVLVNQETAGSAEVLATVLRQADTGLLIGSSTAGQAHPFKDFPLSNGQTLKIASGTVELASGKMLTDQGVPPDIRLNIKAADEKAYIDDPYWSAARITSQAGGRIAANKASIGPFTDRPGRQRRLNEAELVRMQREGLEINRDSTPSASELPKPTVQDLALGRALDFLKGMAVAQSRR